MDNMEQVVGMPEKEEILLNESAMIEGLLSAGDYQNDEAMQKKVQIKRGGRVLFEFRIHALSEEEIQDLRKKCTKYAPNPQGRHLPKIEVETNWVRMRSLKIYEATVEEDKAKFWNNKRVLEHYKVLDPVEVIELALMAGEKDAVIDAIDSLSGYGVPIEDYAKN